MKKVLSLVLCLILALSMFAIVPMTASAAEAELSPTGATSGKTGDCTWSLKGTVLTISGNGNMGHYGASFGPTPWGTAITRVVIKNGVTNIGNFAFLNCDKLSSVVIPGTVTVIGMHAFAGCKSIKSFTIPDTVTEVRASAFSGCSGLENLTIGSSVTSDLDGAFFKCSSLSRITVSSGNPVYDSRDDCNAIIHTGTNTLMLGCKNTVIPNSVTSIGSEAFAGCNSLENITVPDSVTSIGDGAFSDTPWYDNQPDGLVYAGKVAYEYKGSCPASVEIKEGTVSIANFAFSGCSDLETVTIPDSVVRIGENAFYVCKSLENITVPDSVTSIGVGAFDGTLWYDNQPDGLVYAGKVVLGFKNPWDNYYESAEIDEGTLGIADDAFSGCSDLEAVTIPDSVTSIGDEAFRSCESLTSVVIPDSVTSIGREAFKSCQSLTSVVIGNSVTTIGDDAFYECPSLTSVTIPASVTSIGDSAFGYYLNYDSYDRAKVDGFSIQGYNGTAAEQYANDNGFTFISLGDIPSGMILGDADNDGEVTILDATVIQRHIAELSTESYNEAAADADQDGMVTIMDATSIQRHIAELPTNENIGNPI